MLRALIHTGLAVALVLAPTLCCCKAGWLTSAPRHAHTAAIAAQIPAPVPEHESCCLKAKKSCCNTDSQEHNSQPSEKPEPARAPDCACCAERPDAAPPERTVTESDPQPLSQFLALALIGSWDAPAHTESRWANHPPDGTGVDVRYSALFERHVLRC